MEGERGERASVSAGADKKANALWMEAHFRKVIFVSFRTAASAEAPSSPIWLPKRLPSKGWDGDGERAGVSTGPDSKATHRAAAHPRLSIFVCGRTSKSLSRPDISWP